MVKKKCLFLMLFLIETVRSVPLKVLNDSLHLMPDIHNGIPCKPINYKIF